MPDTDQHAEYVARLEGALAWLMTYRNTTVIPPLAVLRTMNEIRVAAGEPPYPLRCEECCGPLDADGWHQSEFADCSRIRDPEADPYEGQDFDYGQPDPGPLMRKTERLVRLEAEVGGRATAPTARTRLVRRTAASFQTAWATPATAPPGPCPKSDTTTVQRKGRSVEA